MAGKRSFTYSGNDHTDKMVPGWLLPYLISLDEITIPAGDMPDFPHGFTGHGRWDYWLDACDRGTIPEDDIPHIAFTSKPDREDERHVQDVLRTYVTRGYWYDDAWLAFVRWLLHGFGRKGLEKEIERIPVEVRNVWYEQFNLAHLLNSPVDWSAYVIQGGLPAMSGNGRHRWAKGAGFYSTPMNVCNFMTAMLMPDTDRDAAKAATVCDPCCGTGSMLLPASNYSLRLYGQDIVYDLCLCAELNGWLWMPWIVFTTPAMERTFDEHDARGRANAAPPPSVGVRLETEPARVEAVRAYRAGEIGQADFFTAMGL